MIFTNDLYYFDNIDDNDNVLWIICDDGKF